jgi:hypothetical protein
MVEAVNLRRQAERALRIARGISDEQAALALRAHAADLHNQADRLEQQDLPVPATQPAAAPQPMQQQQQQQQQIQSDQKDKE